jgi:hypothetical protein
MNKILDFGLLQTQTIQITNNHHQQVLATKRVDTPL